MELFKDINNGKYNTILIVLIFILLFNLYCKQSNIENMTDTDIIDKIDTKYKMTSIRDLYEIYTDKILNGTFDKDCIVKGNVSIGPPGSKINMKYENDGLIFSNSNDDSTVLKIDKDYSIEVGTNPDELQFKYNNNVILDTDIASLEASKKSLDNSKISLEASKKSLDNSKISLDASKTSLDNSRDKFVLIRNNIVSFYNNKYKTHKHRKTKKSGDGRWVKADYIVKDPTGLRY